MSKPIKWIAYLELVKDSPADFCTGSLINSMYVMSAAHCACVEEIQTEACVVKNGKVAINYDPIEKGLVIFLGIISREELASAEAYKVVNIIIHHR